MAILVPVTYVLMLVLERVFPGQKLPKVRWWLLKGLAFFVLGGVFAAIIPAVLSSILGTHTLLHLSVLGTALGAIVGFIAGDIVSYSVHRLLHNVPFLWRWTHQMHHSAERVDIAGANYLHPFDMGVQGTANLFVVFLLGLSPEATVIFGFISFFTAMFQHMNVRTPQWIGWIIQRPEAHAVHHTRGVHAYNYGTFMLWDILFGTFRNPRTFSETYGFWDGASGKVGAMLIGRDVGEPPAAPQHLDAVSSMAAE